MTTTPLAVLKEALERIAGGNSLAWRGDPPAEGSLCDWEMADIAREAIAHCEGEMHTGAMGVLVDKAALVVVLTAAKMLAKDRHGLMLMQYITKINAAYEKEPDLADIKAK